MPILKFINIIKCQSRIFRLYHNKYKQHNIYKLQNQHKMLKIYNNEQKCKNN